MARKPRTKKSEIAEDLKSPPELEALTVVDAIHSARGLGSYGPTNSRLANRDISRDIRDVRNIYYDDSGDMTAGEERLGDEETAKRRAAADEWSQRMLASLPSEYVPRQEILALFFDAVRVRILSALEPSINAQAASMPHNTYEEKKNLAKWVNAELRRFGLALKAPNVEEPCILLANPGNHPNVGRFQLDYTDKNRRRHRTLHSVALPRLELMLDDMTRVPYSRHTERS